MKRKNPRRTRETGLVINKPETSRSAKKRNNPRKDSVSAMLQICPYGWGYSEEIALQQGTNEKGYYLHETMKAEITPEDAFEIHVHHNYDGQRPQDDKWARELAENMVTAVSIDLAIGPAGKAFIMNGQHTLWAIYLRQITTTASISVYQCRDDQAMADLYAIFDSNKIRTSKQVLYAAQNANYLTYEGSVNRLVKWSQCCVVAKNGFSRKNMGKQGNSKKVENVKRKDVQEFAKWMDRHVTESHHMKLVPQAIGAVFYAMFTSDLPNAERFACKYFSGVGLEKGSPILMMRNKMINRSKNFHTTTAAFELTQFMYSVWRKFCLNESLSVLRRTLVIPDFDKWKIYTSSKKMTMLLSPTQSK